MTARMEPQAPGTPTWLDFWVSDTDATRAFFTDLFGYDIPEGSPDFGGYTIAHHDGRYVFGVGPAMPSAPADQAAMYFSTDDIHASVARISALGGRVLMHPHDIPRYGTMAIALDPVGVMFALWQPGGVVGYGAVDEPGFPCWQDCLTTDVEAARTFYGELFGFEFEPMGPGYMAKLGEDGHFLLGPVRDGLDGFWVTYLLVDDVDAAASRATRLGATVLTEPTDLPFGRFVHLRTPGGAPFGLFAGSGDDA